jgi:hypothetical protein
MLLLLLLLLLSSFSMSKSRSKSRFRERAGVRGESAPEDPSRQTQMRLVVCAKFLIGLDL